MKDQDWGDVGIHCVCDMCGNSTEDIDDDTGKLLDWNLWHPVAQPSGMQPTLYGYFARHGHCCTLCFGTHHRKTKKTFTEMKELMSTDEGRESEEAVHDNEF